MSLTGARNRVRRAFWYARHLVEAPPAGSDEACARLSWLAEGAPRHRPGEFRFPFGTVAYVDALTLHAQYVEIFVQLGYDFRCPSESPLILDCGCNIGLATIWFKQRYPRSRVVAFEADPTVAEVLRSNVARLNLTDVEVVAAAVWDRDGTAPFASEGADCGRIDGAGAARVPAVRLADRITGPVDLLKLDVEGAEYDVIRDLCRTGKVRYIDRLICELHVDRQQWDQVAAALTALAEGGLRLTVGGAFSTSQMPGEDQPSPFLAAPDGKCVLQLYAWRPERVEGRGV